VPSAALNARVTDPVPASGRHTYAASWTPYSVPWSRPDAPCGAPSRKSRGQRQNIQNPYIRRSGHNIQKMNIALTCGYTENEYPPVHAA
jgi:hypothetical protein